MPQDSAAAPAASQLPLLRTLYSSAPDIHTRFTLSNPDALAYCQQREHFVIVVPYTIDGRILAERTFSGSDIKWSLVGGALKQAVDEDFLVAAERLAEYNLPGIMLADIEPFAFLENTFIYDRIECKHVGIAFSGRIRNTDVEDILAKSKRTRGHLIDLSTQADAIALPHNQRVLMVAQSHIRPKAIGIVPFHENEISQNELYKNRYAFHDRFVKPAMRLASRVLGEVSLDELDSTTREIILADSPRSIIDVACGENTMCEELSRLEALDLIVGNDISFSQVDLLRKRTCHNRTAATLLYTNHDATNMPFADNTFDVAVCKNVLHHMPDHETVHRLITECARIARKAVVIEVLDPAYENSWGRLRHKYYLNFLHDAYVHFYSASEFNELVTESFACDQRFDLRTFRGVYQFAVLTRKPEVR